MTEHVDLAAVAPVTRAAAVDVWNVLHEAVPDLQAAVKWGQLTFTVDDNWHHWLCALRVTGGGVSLVFHKGTLLADPRHLLHGQGKYTRTLVVPDGSTVPLEGIGDLVREAVLHQTDMLDP